MASNWPPLREGSASEDVRSAQYLLVDHGSVLAVDGTFGPLTDSALRAFQASHGLAVDGIIGNTTWPVLIIQVSSGSSGDAVRAAQSQIYSRASSWVTVDGTFGPETDRAVRFFQEDVGLGADGIVGPQTWNALVSGYLASQSGQGAADAVFTAWANGDRAAALKNATPQAVNQLFARTWQASDGWSFAGCGVAAGSFLCTWNRPGQQLVLEGNDNTGAPFTYIRNAAFEP